MAGTVGETDLFQQLSLGKATFTAVKAHRFLASVLEIRRSRGLPKATCLWQKCPSKCPTLRGAPTAHLGLSPVDLRLDPRLVHLRHEHLVERLAQLAPADAHVAA